jgi:hypothetical protein
MTWYALGPEGLIHVRTRDSRAPPSRGRATSAFVSGALRGSMLPKLAVDSGRLLLLESCCQHQLVSRIDGNLTVLVVSPDRNFGVLRIVSA